MRELKIESLDINVVHSVNLTLRVGNSSLIHITAENRNGDKTISVRVGYEMGIPYAVSIASFDAPNENMDAEEVKNRVLDWLISEEASSIIKKAIN